MAPGTPCDRTPRYGDSYDELTARCYWDYLRIYTPAGSEMLAAEGLTRAKTERGEGNISVFSGEFVLKPGESHEIVLCYRLPNSVASEPYRLLVRKQVGWRCPHCAFRLARVSGKPISVAIASSSASRRADGAHIPHPGEEGYADPAYQ